MRFDAYAGNVYGSASPEQVAEMLAFGLKARVSRGKPRRRYSDVYEVKDGAVTCGWLGKDDHLDTTYFEFKGVTTPDAVASLRKHWATVHRVSRVDSCEDYDDPTAFERLTAIMDGAKDPRVQSTMIAPRDGDRGRTFYWGAKSSAAMVRVYEAGKMQERLHHGKPDWVRAELQMRPSKSITKLASAFMTPLEVWGLSSWTTRAAEALSHVEVPRYVCPQEPPQFDRTTLYLARAFRRHFEEMQADFGSWECIGTEIETIWKLDDEAKGKGPA